MKKIDQSQILENSWRIFFDKIKLRASLNQKSKSILSPKQKEIVFHILNLRIFIGDDVVNGSGREFIPFFG